MNYIGYIVSTTIGNNGQSTYKFDPFCRDWVNLKNNIGQPISHKTRFLQIWPFFVGIGLTWKMTLVNPFPAKLESIQFLQIWPFL